MYPRQAARRSGPEPPQGPPPCRNEEHGGAKDAGSVLVDLDSVLAQNRNDLVDVIGCDHRQDLFAVIDHQSPIFMWTLRVKVEPVSEIAASPYAPLPGKGAHHPSAFDGSDACVRNSLRPAPGVVDADYERRISARDAPVVVSAIF
jgi:hypothetical protein